MTRASVLIAALSGRALAQSARRAGFEPLVADAFGDLDTVAAAAAYVGLPDAVRTGFRASPLIAALERLAKEAQSEPIGLVLGSGFEDKPRLMAALSARFRLLGCGPEKVARAKDPARLFSMLARLAIAHPETRLEAPEHVEGWLLKRSGASGGAHIRDALGQRTSSFPRRRDNGRENGARHRHYYQRQIEGAPVSVLVVAAHDGIEVIGFSRQWTAGQGTRPFRYGGAVGPVQLERTVEDQMRRAAEVLAREWDLVGLVSFDFVEREGVPYLVDINPRPGATLDVFDDDQGLLFARHVKACFSPSSFPRRREPSSPGHDVGGQDEIQIAPLRRGDLGPRLRGDDDEQETSGAMNAVPVRTAAVLYADQGPVVVGAVAWPEWAADRTAPGTRVPAEKPLATVHASGPTPDAAMLQCRARLDGLEDLIYRTATPEKTRRDDRNASHDRTKPERLQARRADR